MKPSQLEHVHMEPSQLEYFINVIGRATNKVRTDKPRTARISHFEAWCTRFLGILYHARCLDDRECEIIQDTPERRRCIYALYLTKKNLTTLNECVAILREFLLAGLFKPSVCEVIQTELRKEWPTEFQELFK